MLYVLCINIFIVHRYITSNKTKVNISKPIIMCLPGSLIKKKYMLIHKGRQGLSQPEEETSSIIKKYQEEKGKGEYKNTIILFSYNLFI